MTKFKKRRYLQRVGNKQSIVFNILEKIKENTPNYNRNIIFVDVFWWWGSVSSNATYYFDNIIYNEIDKTAVKGYIWIQDDKLIQKLKEKWISREEFLKIKAKQNKTAIDNIILTIWSFWNNMQAYLFWKNIEERKRLTHKIIFSKTEEEYKKYIKEYNDKKVAHFEKYGAIWECHLNNDDWNTFKVLSIKKRRYDKFGKKAKYRRKFYKIFDLKELIEKRWKMVSNQDKELVQDIIKIQTGDNMQALENLQSLQALERLQWLERLGRLQSLEALERLGSLQWLNNSKDYILITDNSKIFVNNKDYKELKLPKPDECVLYLDPPYNNIGKWHYINNIDYDVFIEWVEEKKKEWYTIFLSEYNFPFWKIIWEKTKRGFKSQTKDNYTWTEKLYLI